MHLTYDILSPEKTEASILAFQGEGESAFWLEPLYAFYPQLNRPLVESLRGEARAAYLREAVASLYAEHRAEFPRKLAAWQAHWDAHEAEITRALSDAFEEDLTGRWQHMQGLMSLNPISPRFLETASFEVFWLNSERGALGLALHEIIHFLWFDAWQRRYHDDPAGYERPHLPWLLSEMAVEPIMSDPRLAALNPYYPREEGGCVYPYFFDLRLEGENLMDTLHAQHRRLPLGQWMDEARNLLERNREELFRAVLAAEARAMDNQEP